MRKTPFVIFLFLSTTLFANDYHYYNLGGGALVPAEDNNVAIELVDETIVFELFDDHYTITVDFNFYNHEDEIKLLLGFPYIAETKGHAAGWAQGSLYDFQTWVNDEYIEAVNMPLDVDLAKENMSETNYAYVKEVNFPSQQLTKTKIKYNAKYGTDGSYRLASYLYGSGRGWHKSITKANITVKNKSKYWIYLIRKGELSLMRDMSSNEYLNHYWNNDTIEFSMNDFEPGYNDSIRIGIWVPMFDFGQKPLPYYFYHSGALFRQNDLYYLTKDQLRILRNLFYALHGYNFKDAYLKKYYEEHFGFYEVNSDFNEDLLNNYERQNIDIIRKEELDRN